VLDKEEIEEEGDADIEFVAGDEDDSEEEEARAHAPAPLRPPSPAPAPRAACPHPLANSRRTLDRAVQPRRHLRLGLPPLLPLLRARGHRHQLGRDAGGQLAAADEVLRDLGQPLLVLVDQELGPVLQVRVQLRQRLLECLNFSNFDFLEGEGVAVSRRRRRGRGPRRRQSRRQQRRSASGERQKEEQAEDEEEAEGDAPPHSRGAAGCAATCCAACARARSS